MFEIVRQRKIPLELIVQVYNINCGHNTEILKKCETLGNYSIFVGKIREFQAKDSTLEEAVKLAVKYCIKNNILKKFLVENSSEVQNMLITEYDRDMDIAVNRREAWEEGREEGREEWNLIIAKNMLEKGSSFDFIHDITGLSPDEIKKL
jgi:hypothetical protein